MVSVCFFEMSAELRAGRKRYITTSFIITCLAALTGSLDMASHFQSLFMSTSRLQRTELMQSSDLKDWKLLFSGIALGISVWIGDVLLVSTYPHKVHTCY